MKKIIILCLLSLFVGCSADDGTVTEEEVTLFVNHYRTTPVLSNTALLVQENNAIGSEDFHKTRNIKSFTFEPGHTYLLTVSKITTKNPGTDASTVSYELIRQEEKNIVFPQTTFEVPLTRFINGAGYVSFIVGSETLGFVLGNRISVDCNNLCAQLETVLGARDIATGTFTHGTDGTYVLQTLY